MEDKRLETILKALASHIEMLETKIFILEHEKEQLKKDNDRLREAEKWLVDQLASSEVDNGVL